MTKQDQKSGKPGHHSGTQEQSPARAKDQSRETKTNGKDMPGADGPLSAGAEEDTYD